MLSFPLQKGTQEIAPYSPSLWKDLNHEGVMRLMAKRKQLRALLCRAPRRVMLCHPHTPEFFHVLSLVAARCRIMLTSDPKKSVDLAIAFNDTTSFPLDERLLSLKKNGRVLNGHCTDISKSRVEDIFESVFGYGIKVDPRTYVGKCLKKSDSNATHDGMVIECPKEPERGFVYQKLIDNTDDGKEYYDMRVFIVGATIPFVFKKIRNPNPALRFGISIDNKIGETRDVLSAGEVETILKFTHTCGLDFGELDVLRDRTDGKIYVVDANNTAGCPHPGYQISHSDFDTYTERLAAAFAAEFLDGTC